MEREREEEKEWFTPFDSSFCHGISATDELKNLMNLKKKNICEIIRRDFLLLL